MTFVLILWTLLHTFTLKISRLRKPKTVFEILRLRKQNSYQQYKCKKRYLSNLGLYLFNVVLIRSSYCNKQHDQSNLGKTFNAYRIVYCVQKSWQEVNIGPRDRSWSRGNRRKLFMRLPCTKGSTLELPKLINKYHQENIHSQSNGGIFFKKFLLSRLV